VFGLERGFCLMIGGDAEPVRRLDPIFLSIAPGEAAAPSTPGRVGGASAQHGYLHCGPAGAGHFVKMVHNGIEYGVMAAYAAGALFVLVGPALGCLRRAPPTAPAPARPRRSRRAPVRQPATSVPATARPRDRDVDQIDHAVTSQDFRDLQLAMRWWEARIGDRFS
jgi:6-phosphogluconate dehydrogenase, C-terminal domain